MRVLVLSGLYCTGGDLAVTNCVFRRNTLERGRGAGICILEATATVRDCLVEQNSITPAPGYGVSRGAGICCDGYVEITGCTVLDNIAEGLDACGGVHASGETTIRDCLIAGNISSSGAYGGGVVCRGLGPVHIVDCIIVENECHGGFGGGVSMPGGGQAFIDKCLISRNMADRGGGGVAGDSSGASPPGMMTITNSIITENATGLDPEIASWGGGGVLCPMEATVSIDKCTIANNTAHMGYGQHGGGGVCVASRGTGTITRCNVFGNTVMTGEVGWDKGIGGGIAAAWQTTLTISDCRVVGNTAAFAGGGIACIGTAHIARCLVAGNTLVGRTDDDTRLTAQSRDPVPYGFYLSGGMGGGIATTEDGTTIVGCTIVGNTARGDDTGGNGGGLSAAGDTLVSNCLIAGNRAVTGSNSSYESGYGGGVLLRAGLVNLANCTIAHNRAATGKPGTYVYTGTSHNLRNCAIWGNGPIEIGTNSDTGLAVAYSTVAGGWPGMGNIDSDPLFIDPGYWDNNGTPDDIADDEFVPGDYRLLPGSPSVNAGIQTSYPSLARPTLTAMPGCCAGASTLERTSLASGTWIAAWMSIWQTSRPGSPASPVLGSERWSRIHQPAGHSTSTTTATSIWLTTRDSSTL